MSIGNDKGEALTIQELPDYTDQYRSLFIELAKQYKMHIIGGTHVIRKGDRLYNVAYMFYPDGRVVEQANLHITPTEVHEWNMSPGDGLEVFETEKGKIAMLTCYDIEFQEIRTWRTNFRGPLAIHTSKKLDKVACNNVFYQSLLSKYGYTKDNLPTGVIIAECKLKNCLKVIENNQTWTVLEDGKSYQAMIIY